jgi:hypothetical protein
MSPAASPIKGSRFLIGRLETAKLMLFSPETVENSGQRARSDRRVSNFEQL